MPYEAFSWFANAPVKHINLEDPHSGYLYWPHLDVDLSIDIIEHPERFPLIANLPAPQVGSASGAS